VVARAALERGEILSAREIVRRMSARIGHDLLRIELERERGRWLYEIKYVDGQGRVQSVSLDARSGVPLAAPAGTESED